MVPTALVVRVPEIWSLEMSSVAWLSDWKLDDERSWARSPALPRTRQWDLLGGVSTFTEPAGSIGSPFLSTRHVTPSTLSDSAKKRLTAISELLGFNPSCTPARIGPTAPRMSCRCV